MNAEAPSQALRLRMRDVVTATGVPASTIHYYIQIGLLPEPDRTNRNQALYGIDSIERVEIIKLLNQQGHLTLAEIRDALSELDDVDLAPDASRKARRLLETFLRALTTSGDTLGLGPSVTGGELAARHVDESTLQLLAGVGLIDAEPAPHPGGEPTYSVLDALVAVRFAEFEAAAGDPVSQVRFFQLFAKYVRSMARAEVVELVRNTVRTTREVDVERILPIMRARDAVVTAIHARELALALEEAIEGGRSTAPEGHMTEEHMTGGHA